MWSDNETTKDLLNYEIHCNLLKEYLTNSNLLPLTVGVFGDWGSGKSSIMKMLEENLQQEEKILTIYFNSWLFESYDDAKISILENIILELSKNEKLTDKAKKKLLQLLSRIDYMKIAKDGFKKYAKNIIDVFSTGGVSTAIEASLSMLNQEKITELLKEDIDSSKLKKYIKEEQTNTSKTTIKSFQKDFEKLIELTEFDSVVIFIDDLDRCLPERVIDTLEAIKLFLSVKKTAFVIAADERILKHAISMHLKLYTFKNDSSYLQTTEQIVTDYIEKLIQIPYRIPKLSPTEIESYTNLLFCLNNLEEEAFNKIYEHYSNFKKENFYSSYSIGHIEENISLSDYPELVKLLHLSYAMSQMITNVLKGNPRQTKRFLNTFILRKRLAKVAQLNIDELVLIKLMLLEYTNLKLFKEINESQSKNKGTARELQLLENKFINKENITLDFPGWEEKNIQKWITIKPRIGEVDLRNYFWLVRDKTESTLSTVHMAKPHIQRFYYDLTSNDKHLEKITISTIKDLDSDEILEIIDLLKIDIKNNPSKLNHSLKVLSALIEELNQLHYQELFFDTIQSINYISIKDEFYIATKVENSYKEHSSLREKGETILQDFSYQKGKLAKRAKQILEKK